MFVLYSQNNENDGYHFLQRYALDKTDLSILWYDLAFVKNIDLKSKEYHDFLVNVVLGLVNDLIYKDDQIILVYMRC